MFWKVLFRTLQFVVGIGGLVIGVIGVYFDVQASQMPIGLFGLSILAWGFILLAVTSVSVIGQLWWHISKTDESYKYSLSLNDLKLLQDDRIIRFTLEISNAIDKPLGYEFDGDKYYVEINGIRQLSEDKGLKRTILSRKERGAYRLPEMSKPDNYPCSILIHCEFIYGYPERASFRQIREMEVHLFGSRQKAEFNYVFREPEYRRLRSKFRIF